MKRFVILAAALMLTAAGANAASIDVNNGAALEGNYGLEVAMNATTASAFVSDETPDNETVYRAQFLVDWNDLDFAAQDNGPLSTSAIFKVWDMDQPGGVERQHTVVGFRYDLAGNRRVWMKVTDLVGGTTPTARYTEWGMPGAAGYPATVMVEFDQSANEVRLCRQNAFPGSTMTCNTVAANVSQYNVDRVTLGSTGGADAETTGSYFLDSFESYRTLSTP